MEACLSSKTPLKSIFHNYCHLFLGFFFSISYSYSQIPLPQVTTVGNNPMSAAQHLAGNGVTILSATFTGDIDQCALFTNGAQTIGFPEGIALTTGNSSFAGTVACLGTGCTESEVDAASSASVPDLNIPDNLIQRSPATLDFTFTSINTHIEFEFSFASEEYPEYVGSVYNDRFIFILSGPGINGPFTNSGENIARLPNGGDIISINTVNSGINSAFYIPNYWNGPQQSGPAVDFWRYDGKTTVIKIEKDIQCNVEYRLRLIIANIGDNNFDSGVFFKKGSLKAPFNLGLLTAQPATVCEGQPINLTVLGSESYIYEWSTGQQGLNLKSITEIAQLGTNEYSVEAYTPDGCLIGTRSVDVVVHSTANIPPYMNGINNSGIYDAYVRAGELLEFQIPTFDSDNEKIEFIWSLPTLGVQSVNSSPPKEIGIFKWTPLYNQIGTYEINAFCVDNNVCGSLPSLEYTFYIHVICPYCELVVDYANRSPQANPLPPLTEAAIRITAGINGPVEVGNEQVIFRAPDIVLDANGFISGPEFIAEYIAVCTETDCDACCETQNIDNPVLYFPNVFTPNGDGLNDVWHVIDLSNPFCAFNSRELELLIYDPWGALVYSKSISSEQCCPFKTPPAALSNVLNPLSWNGTCNVGSFNNPPIGDLLPHGVYFYVYTINTCNGQINGSGFVELLGGSARYAASIDSSSIDETLLTKTSEDFELLVFPNPSSDNFNIKIIKVDKDRIKFTVIIHDLIGRELMSIKLFNETTALSLNSFANGCYLVSLLDENNTLVAQTKIIKQ